MSSSIAAKQTFCSKRLSLMSSGLMSSSTMLLLVFPTSVSTLESTPLICFALLQRKTLKQCLKSPKRFLLSLMNTIGKLRLNVLNLLQQFWANLRNTLFCWLSKTTLRELQEHKKHQAQAARTQTLVFQTALPRNLVHKTLDQQSTNHKSKILCSFASRSLGSALTSLHPSQFKSLVCSNFNHFSKTTSYCTQATLRSSYKLIKKLSLSFYLKSQSAQGKRSTLAWA